MDARLTQGEILSILAGQGCSIELFEVNIGGIDFAHHKITSEVNGNYKAEMIKAGANDDRLSLEELMLLFQNLQIEFSAETVGQAVIDACESRYS